MTKTTSDPVAAAAPNALFDPPPIGENRAYRCAAAVNAGRGSLMIDGEIGYWGVTAKMVRDALGDMGNVSDIDVVINSPGGLIGEGVSIYNALKRHDANVHVSIEGYALSMGSIIAMAGDTVSMADNALFMIHNPIGGAWGDAATLRKEADVLDKHKSALIASYAARPNVSLTDLEIVAAMDAETWYTAAEAREAGFVDQVVEVEAEEVNSYAVNLPVAAVQNAPAWVLEVRERALARAVATQPPAEAGTTTEEEEDMNSATASRQATAQAAAAAPPKTDATDDATRAAEVQTEREAAALAERARAKGIREAFSTRLASHPNAAALAERYIENGTSVEEASRVITDLVELTGDTEPAAGDATITRDARDGTRDGIRQALLSRAGVEKIDRGNEFRGMTLSEMAAETLRANGVRPSGGRRDRVGAAFTHSTSDFPTILEDVARRTLMDAYREREETFEQFTRATSLTDFRTAKRAGMLEFAGELDARPEGAEYKHKTLAEFSESISLDTYGNKFSITREAIINDDLGALIDVPQKFGRLARRTVAAHVFRVFAQNPVMSDGAQLFSTEHGNLAGTGATLTSDSVDAALTAMALNKGRYKDNAEMGPANVVPNILLVPMALRSRAITVMEAEFQVHAGAADSNRNPNTVRNAMQVIADPRLDAISTTAWYLIDGANAPIDRAYLDGEQEPFLDSVQGWDIDGTEWKIRLDLGVAPMEYMSIYKQPGA